MENPWIVKKRRDYLRPRGPPPKPEIVFPDVFPAVPIGKVVPPQIRDPFHDPRNKPN